MFSGDIQQFYKVNNYYEPLDKLLKELKMQFLGKGHETLTNLASVIFENEVKDEAFEDVLKFYGLDIDLLKADHRLFKHYKAKIERNEMTDAEMFKKLTENDLIQLMPELSKALKIFPKLPCQSPLVKQRGLSPR